MSFEERVRGAYDSGENLEQFYRDLLDPFVGDNVWNFDGDLDHFVEGQAEWWRIQFEDNMTNEKAGELLEEYEDVLGREFSLHYGDATLRMTIGDDLLFSGRLEYDPECIDNSGQAEPESLLDKLRDTYEGIVNAAETEYIEKQDDLNSATWLMDSSENRPEQLAEVKIPYEYNDVIMAETIEGLSYTAKEIHSLHRALRALAKGYEPE